MADDRLERAYQQHRTALLALSYRMLGSFVDAEDVVQEAFIRLERALARGEQVDSERAYLTTVTTRLAIDHLRSARVRREQYVGPWLPEPAVEGLTDLADAAAWSDSLSTAFLLLLDQLTPEQRAVLLMRDVFAYEFDEIAATIGKSPAACRQLAVRARRAVRVGRPRRASDLAERRRLADAFFRAAQHGDLEVLTTLLAEDARFVGDGGRSGRGVSRPVHGRGPVSMLVGNLMSRMAGAGIRVELTGVGAEPAALLIDPEGHLIGVWSLVLAEDASVQAVHGMVNPDKLGHLGLPLTTLTRGDWRGR
ncbi:RNA polymerase sigma factor SigJ [Pseudonocardia sp. C8]|nr:RNA polymerase sigma factor SigJ [Pseudonocardia sp. C8]